MTSIREKAVAGLAVGDTFVVERTFTATEVSTFASVSRDHNPVHFDRRFAELEGFPAPICHGLLVASLLTEIGGEIGCLASAMSFRFTAPVYPGDTVTCRFTVAEIDDRDRLSARVLFTNQSGTPVLEATVSGRGPNLAERERLAALGRESVE